MNEDEVQQQLNHMVNFISREAEEKAAEIRSKADEEFAIEKARLVNEEKLKITKEFERKEKQIDVKKKIAHSTEINQARLRLLKAREEAIQKVLEEAHKNLIKVCKSPQYKDLLKKLIVQGLIKIDEEKVTVVCRQEDLGLVESVLADAVNEYKQTSKKNVSVSVDKSVFLPPGPDRATNQLETCSGGVLLSAMDGKILCSNTLDARLSMAFEQQLPQVRGILFDAKAKK